MITGFIGNLSCPLEIGNALIIAGKTIDSATEFQINLRTSKYKNAELGLHLSVRFNEDIIIRNSLIDDIWGTEERYDNLISTTPPNPIIEGEFFIVCVLICENNFHISINHRSYCTYKYRIPIEDIRTVEIIGHVQVITQVDHRTIYPCSWPPIQITDSKILFSNDIPVLFTPGHVIVMTACPGGNRRGRFLLVFYEGDTKREGIHLSVRFYPDYVVVRNAMKQNSEFGAEEREGGFPFIFNEQFRLAIAFTDRAVKFAVNGNYFCSFLYRTPNLLANLNGFKASTVLGMTLEVTSVDHVLMGDSTCDGFERYSNQDYDII